MLEWRSYVVGTCHGMSPKALLMRGVASEDMPWHANKATTQVTTMNQASVLHAEVTCYCLMASDGGLFFCCICR